MTDKKYFQDLGNVCLGSECYVVKDDKVLMFKRSATSSRFPGFWIGPGGHIDENETPLTAAIREISEEANIKIEADNTKLKAIAFHHHLDKNEIWISFIFLSSIPHDQVVKEEFEEGKSAWVPMNELNKMDDVFPPTKYYFDHLFNNKPGILYVNAQWEKAQLIKILDQGVDKN